MLSLIIQETYAAKVLTTAAAQKISHARKEMETAMTTLSVLVTWFVEKIIVHGVIRMTAV